MTRKYLLQGRFGYPILALIISLLTASMTVGQGAAKLEINVETRGQIAHGGEIFPYTVRVINTGTAIATNVELISAPDDVAAVGATSSGVPTKGVCKESKSFDQMVVRCKFGDLIPGESVTVEIEAKLEEFGDASLPEPASPNAFVDDASAPPPPPPPPAASNVNKRPLDSAAAVLKVEPDSGVDGNQLDQGNIIARLRVVADNVDENESSHRRSVLALVRPSRNVPPRIEIVSPKNKVQLTKVVGKAVQVPILVKAYDPDGTVEKVLVITQSRIEYVLEDGELKYSIGGKTYSQQELSSKEDFTNLVQEPATADGKGNFYFLYKNPKYVGSHGIQFKAVDNGGRVAFAELEIEIKSNSTIELVKPTHPQVFSPGSDIVVEFVANSREKTSDVTLTVADARLGVTGKLQQFKASLISKNGNSSRYRFLWRKVPAGLYALGGVLTDDSKLMTPSMPVLVLVNHPPKVQILSLKNGQSFNLNESILLELDASDDGGTIAEVNILIDGEPVTSGSADKVEFKWTSYRKVSLLSGLASGRHTLEIEVTDDLGSRSKSQRISFFVR